MASYFYYFRKSGDRLIIGLTDESGNTLDSDLEVKIFCDIADEERDFENDDDIDIKSQALMSFLDGVLYDVIRSTIGKERKDLLNNFNIAMKEQRGWATSNKYSGTKIYPYNLRND